MADQAGRALGRGRARPEPGHVSRALVGKTGLSLGQGIALAGIWTDRVILVGLVAAFLIGFSWLSIRRHEALQSNGEDLGFTDQIVWNTLRGRPFEFSLYEHAAFDLDIDPDAFRRPESLLAYHVEPLLLGIAPVYLIWSDPRALLIVQAAGLGLGALPAYALARRGLGPAAGLALAVVYLLGPPLHWAALDDFHTIALAAPLLVWQAACARAQRWGWFAIAALLAASTKEEVGVAVALLALGVRRRWGGGRWTLGAAALALLWTGICFLVIIPAFAGGASPFLVRYAPLGSTPADMLLNLWRDPARVIAQIGRGEVANQATLLLWTGGLPVLAPALLVAALPSVAANSLSEWTWMAAGRAHYSAAVAGILYVATVAGAESLAGRLRSARRLPCFARRQAVAIAVAPACAGAVLAAWQAGLIPGGPGFAVPRVGDHERLAARLLAQIPPGAAVSASQALVPHLSQRRSIYLFPTVRDAEYILVDLSHPAGPFTVRVPEVRDRVIDLLDTGTYGVQDAADGFLLLQRGAPQRTIPAEFYTFTRSGAGLLADPGRRGAIGSGDAGSAIVEARLWQSGAVGIFGPPWTLDLTWRLADPGSEIWPVVRAYRDDRPLWESGVDVPAQWWQPPEAQTVGSTRRLRFFDVPGDPSEVRVWTYPTSEAWERVRSLPVPPGRPVTITFAATASGR